MVHVDSIVYTLSLIHILLPAIDILSLAKPENHGNATAVVEYKITGLPSNVAIQNFVIGSKYIYVTQHAGNNTLLSRCRCV